MVAVNYGLQLADGQWTLYGLTKDVPDAARLAVNECFAFGTEGKFLAIQIRVEHSGGADLSGSAYEQVNKCGKGTWLEKDHQVPAAYRIGDHPLLFQD